MKRVPNIVFLIIAIIGLTAAGIIFSMYSSEKEMSSNSLNKITELEKDVNNLMNKNSDLMMQMSGVEDQKKKLEEKITEEDIKCDINECLNGPITAIYGLATIEGYYSKEEVEYTGMGEEESEILLCDRFVITGGSEKLINAYINSADGGSAFFNKNNKNQPIININLNDFVEEEKNMVLESGPDNMVSIIVFEEYELGHGVPGDACYPGLIKFLRVSKSN